VANFNGAAALQSATPLQIEIRKSYFDSVLYKSAIAKCNQRFVRILFLLRKPQKKSHLISYLGRIASYNLAWHWLCHVSG